MGIFKKIGKVFKKIGKGVKKVFKKFGKFMGKIGIVGQIAMMFVLPGIGAALMKGFGALWTGVVGQTAAGATASAAGATAGAAASASATAAGATAAQAAAAGATATATTTAATAASIQAGTTAITSTATGMLGSSSAVVRGAGMVLEKGAQFARTIQAGYKTVSQAVTGAFEETGKWIGGKLGMKTAEGAAMQGSWANYSQAVTDSFATLKDNATDFWSPIKGGPVLDVGLDSVSTTASELGNSSSTFIANTTPNISTDSAVPRTESVVTGDLSTDLAVSKPPTSLLDKTGTYIKETPQRLFQGATDFIAETPGRVLKSEATGALYDAAGLTPEPLDIQGEETRLYGNYVPEFQGKADAYAQTMGYDFGQYITGNEQTFGNYGEEGGQFGGALAYSNYFNKLQNSGATA